MKKIVIAAVALGLAACQPAEDTANASEKAATPAAEMTQDAAAAPAFADENDKASYAIGLKYGESMKRDLSELQLKTFYRGFSDGFEGKEPAIKAEDIVATLQALQTRKMSEMKEKADAAGAGNKTDGDKYLADNKKREGVITLESGLQYEVLTVGKGESPTKDDKVNVHYHGTLIDGTVFDSSVDRGKPATFGVGQVIKGWTEALQLMKTGDKWKVFIPSELAYGARGAGGKIGPNAALVFEVELISIEKKSS